MIALKGVKNEITLKAYARIFGDGAKETTVSFSVTWKKMEVDEAVRYVEKIQDGEITDRQIVDDNALNITGLKDANDGEDLNFTPELVDEIFKSREYKTALVNSFFEAQTGRKQVATKN